MRNKFGNCLIIIFQFNSSEIFHFGFEWTSLDEIHIWIHNFCFVYLWSSQFFKNQFMIFMRFRAILEFGPEFQNKREVTRFILGVIHHSASCFSFILLCLRIERFGQSSGSCKIVGPIPTLWIKGSILSILSTWLNDGGIKFTRKMSPRVLMGQLWINFIKESC